MRKPNFTYLITFLFLCFSFPAFLSATGMEDGEETRRDIKKPGYNVQTTPVNRCTHCNETVILGRRLLLTPDHFPFAIDDIVISGYNLSSVLPVSTSAISFYAENSFGNNAFLNMSNISQADFNSSKSNGRLTINIYFEVLFCGGAGIIPDDDYQFSFTLYGREASNPINPNKLYSYSANVSTNFSLSPLCIVTNDDDDDSDDEDNGGTLGPQMLRKSQKDFSKSLSNLYPNPTLNNSTLSLNLPSKSLVRLDAYNSMGQMVKSNLINQELAAGIHEQILNFSGLSPGFYHAKLIIGNTVKTIKFQKI